MTKEKKDLKFYIGNEKSLSTKKWFSVPGHPEISFLCSQALNIDMLKAVDEAKKPVYLQDGSVAMNENGVIEKMENATFALCNIDVICKCTHDWKGKGVFYDPETGEEMPFSKEAMKVFLLKYGDKTIQDGETEIKIKEWLKATIYDNNSFIQGDVKN